MIGHNHTDDCLDRSHFINSFNSSAYKPNELSNYKPKVDHYIDLLFVIENDYQDLFKDLFKQTKAPIDILGLLAEVCGLSSIPCICSTVGLDDKARDLFNWGIEYLHELPKDDLDAIYKYNFELFLKIRPNIIGHLVSVFGGRNLKNYPSYKENPFEKLLIGTLELDDQTFFNCYTILQYESAQSKQELKPYTPAFSQEQTNDCRTVALSYNELTKKIGYKNLSASQKDTLRHKIRRSKCALNGLITFTGKGKNTKVVLKYPEVIKRLIVELPSDPAKL